MTRSPCSYSSLWVSWLAVATVACHSRSSGSIHVLEPFTLVFRVLDDHGPLVRTELEVSLEEKFGSVGAVSMSNRNRPVVSDDDGFLRWQLSTFETIDPIRFSMTVTSKGLYGMQRGLATRHGEMRLEDLVLAPMPVVASGRVIDIRGNPVSGAQVFAADERDLPGPRSTTDEDGRFALSVPRELESGTQSLMAFHEGGISEILDVVEGARDVDLSLSTATGSFTGKVLLDTGIPTDRMEVEMTSIDRWVFDTALSDNRPESEGILDSQGAFLFSNRIPGRYSVWVRVDGLALAEIQDVIVHAGSNDTDPRSDPIDLRGRIHVARLTLVAPASSSTPRGHFSVRGVGQENWGSGVSITGPEVLALSPYEAPDIKLVVHGFRSLVLEGVREDRDVHLEPGWPIRLVLIDDILLPEPPVSWSVLLHSRGRGPVSPPISFEPGRREARGIAVETGVFEVEWIRSVGEDETHSFWGHDGWPGHTVEVRDVPGEQKLQLGWVPVPR